MLKRIAVTELRVGMYVHELCGSWMEHPFWRPRFSVKDEDTLRRILESGIQEAWIDSEKGADIETAAPAADLEETQLAIDRELGATSASIPPAPARISMDDEIDHALEILGHARPALFSMFSEARMGRAIDEEEIGSLVDEISRSVARNPFALISLSRLRHADEYTYMHSAAVSAMMIALARQLECDETFVREAGMAGMLHDIGKARVPFEILNKPGALTDAEFAQMKAHPRCGHELLQDLGMTDPAVLDACLHHHEKIDGSGYPDGLSGDRVSLIARMTAVCDVYDAITSNRPYKAAWSPAESIRKMAEWQRPHFDPQVFHAFVKTVGVYPVGSLVRLANDRLAIVVAIDDRPLLRPLVKAIYSIRAKARIAPELIDLAAPGSTGRIVGPESPQSWGLAHLDELWAGDAANWAGAAA